MILWSPSDETINNANVTVFKTNIESKFALKFLDFHQFREWTVENSNIFWEELAAYLGIVFKKPFVSTIENPDAMPGAHWFKDAELNFTENLLRFDDAKNAIVFWNETGFKESISYSELKKRVLDLREFLIQKGVRKGDAVAGYMPNIPETVISFLATASLGAVWSSSSPDFSVNAVYDRFSQLNPKVLIAADGYLYKGKKVSSLDNIKNLTEKISSIESVIICPYINQTPDFSHIRNAVSLNTVKGIKSGPIIFESFASDQPLLVLYSSGTTGKPKCIVHGTIGILIELAKEHSLEVDIKREDVVFYNTTCGWMMWNWLVGVLFQGATIVLYDGFALQENQEGNVIFKMLEKEKITVFGTSASYLQKIEETGLVPKDKYKLTSLRSILSTGSRLKPESFDYVYKSIANVHLSPIWGGTDLCGCLGISSPVLPVRRGEIQTRGLGMAVDVVDDNLKPVVNEAGEVVVRKPFPSMPLYFLNDPDGAKYKAAYFEHFPGVWRHGDLAILTENKGIIVLGRSDDTLNPGGVRIGAAEVTQAAESINEVAEAMAVSQPWDNDERIILFLIMKQGFALTQDIKDKILGSMPSPRHKPKKIIAVPDFPTTLSGKRSVKTVRDIIQGKDPGNKDALANPAVIEIFKNLTELLRK